MTPRPMPIWQKIVLVSVWVSAIGLVVVLAGRVPPSQQQGLGFTLLEFAPVAIALILTILVTAIGYTRNPLRTTAFVLIGMVYVSTIPLFVLAAHEAYTFVAIRPICQSAETANKPHTGISMSSDTDALGIESANYYECHYVERVTNVPSRIRLESLLAGGARGSLGAQTLVLLGYGAMSLGFLAWCALTFGLLTVVWRRRRAPRLARVAVNT